MTKLEKARRARIKAGKAKASDIHTSKWWSKRYLEAKRYARSKGIELSYKSRKEFTDAYLSAQRARATQIEEYESRGYKSYNVDRHSVQFFDYQYEKLKKYAEEKGLTSEFKAQFSGDSRSARVRNFMSVYRSMVNDGSERPLDDMRYFLKYKTSYRTALFMYRQAKSAREEWEAKKERSEIAKALYKQRQEEIEDVEERIEAGEVIDQDYLDEISDIKTAASEDFDEPEPERILLRDMQNMTTKEFATKYKDMLRAAYDAKREEGASSKEAKEYVSAQWFGSP